MWPNHHLYVVSELVRERQAELLAQALQERLIADSRPARSTAPVVKLLRRVRGLQPHPTGKPASLVLN
jgi:hypothetical protein